MKKYLLAILPIVGLLFVTSCSEDDYEDATLALSKNVIEFANKGDEESIAVTTDVEHWSAIGSADWIKVNSNGTNLVVKVDANETVYDREGKVLVIAGNANATISIMQKGLKGSVTVVPNNINLEDNEGQFIVEINANDNKWSAESDSDWLRVTAKPYKAELVLDYTKNMHGEDRVALVTLTVGNDKTVVEVKQLGRMFFLLPYMDFKNGTREKVVNFEEERKNTLDEESSDETALSFKTRSLQMFPTLDYVFDEDGKISKAVLFAIDGEEMKKNTEEFYEFLKQNGFEEESGSFVDKKNSISVKIYYTTIWGLLRAHVEFKTIPTQDKEYPTFKKFPYGFIEWGKKQTDVDAYEKENGGVYNEDASVIDEPEDNYNFLWYDIDREKQGEGETVARVYYVNKPEQLKPGLSQAVQIMKNTSLVFFTSKEDAIITKEFKALCEKEGFVYEGLSDGGYHIFINNDKKLNLGVRYYTFEGDSTPSLLFNISPLSEEADVLKISDNKIEQEDKILEGRRSVK